MDQVERDRRWTHAKERRIAARLCFDQRLYSESITLSYYVCYQAMWIAVGDPPTGLWRHGGLINEFCRGRWQTPPARPQELAPLRKKVDRLYLYRLQGDYEGWRLRQGEAQEALDTLEEVLRRVAQPTGLPL